MALTYGAFVVGALLFWPAFVFAAGIALAISVIKQGMLKKWVSHCFFAKDAKGNSAIYYSSLDEELRAFGNAVGGT
jgi:hypothetical protein